jgi:L-fuconolactonase
MREPPSGGVVDAHHHLWVRSRHAQDWIDPHTMAAIDADFEPADLAEHAEAAGVTRTVVVQSIASVPETVDLLRTAADTELIGGVVGWVDLTTPDVADRLDELKAGYGGDRLVGIRHLVQSEVDPYFLDRADVRRGIAAVGAAGAVFDLVVRDHQLPSAVRLARDLPEVSFVLDHLGKPRLERGELQDWASALTELAQLPNTAAKLSGLATEADWSAWTPADLRPAVSHALEVFGADRLMFGSDWPVCLLATSYGRWIEVLSGLLDECADHETAMIWEHTARRVYGSDVW